MSRNVRASIHRVGSGVFRVRRPSAVDTDTLRLVAGSTGIVVFALSGVSTLARAMSPDAYALLALFGLALLASGIVGPPRRSPPLAAPLVHGADAFDALQHDHTQLTALVSAVATRLRGGSRQEGAAALERLAGELLTHFEIEETVLFPELRALFPDLRAKLAALERTHDLLCGGVARLLRANAKSASREPVLRVLERFEIAFEDHAAEELRMLVDIERRFTPDQRELVASLLACA